MLTTPSRKLQDRSTKYTRFEYRIERARAHIKRIVYICLATNHLAADCDKYDNCAENARSITDGGSESRARLPYTEL